jgi:zinc-ribbon domain
MFPCCEAGNYGRRRSALYGRPNSPPRALCETGAVGEQCTCGATLPPDARFCHKCGKPQFEAAEPELEVQPEVSTAPPPAPPLPPDINFHNPLAVKIGLLMALLSFFASAVSGQLFLPQFLPLLWMMAAGFLSVYLYRRRTGQVLTVRGGARLGWITGVFSFVIIMVLFTMVVVAISDHTAAAMLTEQLKERGAGAQAGMMIEAFQKPDSIIQILLAFFLICGILPTVGGVLGAKLLDRH